MAPTIGILLFEGADELDFVGPLNVFSYACGWGKDGQVVTIGRRHGELRGVNGLLVRPQHDFQDAPPLDVVVVPGGLGAMEASRDEAVLQWLARVSATARWTCSVCTGSFILSAAGLVEGRRITTHSGMTEKLRAEAKATVIEGERFVVDGGIVTSAGVSAGIDMALWVVARLFDTARSDQVRCALEYHSSPAI